MKHYVDFWQVTGEALRWVARKLQIEASERELSSVMEAYFSPDLFADARAGLDGLQAYPLAILSNGSPKMLDAVVRANGLETRFTHVISVDEVRTLQTVPRSVRTRN